jgi:hypothetical protein
VSFKTISHIPVAREYIVTAEINLTLKRLGRMPEIVKLICSAAILNRICPAANSTTVERIRIICKNDTRFFL